MDTNVLKETGICYAALTIALLTIWSTTPKFKISLSIASASLEFLALLFIVSLSWLEHSRTLRPSFCDAVRLRTLFLMQYPTVFVTLTSIHIA
jgi:ATP-binding cassette subfamily C (CFTR/MRP) protein 1